MTPFTQKLAYQARTASGWNEPLLQCLGIELPLAVGWLGRALGQNVTQRQHRAFRKLLGPVRRAKRGSNRKGAA